MRILLSFFFLLMMGLPLAAQQHRLLRDDLQTLRCEVEGELQSFPVVRLRSGERMEVSFDQMSHDYHRFFYRVEHCDMHWQPTEGLFRSEFLESTQDDILIASHTQSRNTNVLYTHYSFSFPSSEARPTISGNYRITIYDDSSDEPEAVAQVVCAVVEPLVGVGGQVSTNTEIDWNEAHQQLSLTLQAQALQARDLRSELQGVVLQNGSWQHRRTLPPPTHINGTTLLWQHSRELIFPAGNEYRSFEILSTQQAGMRVERIAWIEPLWYATLFADEPRRNYLKWDDRNGTSVVRNIDNQDDATESEYVMTDFCLQMPRLLKGEVWLDGRWAVDAPAAPYRLQYDEARQCYALNLLLKQGYYSYRYLVVGAGEEHSSTAPIEGDYFQTNNDYKVLIYHQSPSDRYQRLVGYGFVNYQHS